MKVYKSEKARKKIYETYDKLLTMWGVGIKERDIDTAYGSTHVIECGTEGNPPLVLFHGVGDDSALMWIYNAKELSAHFHIFAVDTMGGPGKSQPNEKYKSDFDEIKWLDDVFNGLGIDRAYVAGVSNGAYITQHVGIMRPDRVIKLICMSGSAVSVNEKSSHMTRMLKVFLPEALFPTNKNIARLIKKLAGKNYAKFTGNPTIMEHFMYLMRGFNKMSMANHKIESFSEDQIRAIRDKALFLCGESDPLGDMESVKTKMMKYGLSYQFFPDVGHGINHEISEKINQMMIQYFS